MRASHLTAILLTLLAGCATPRGPTLDEQAISACQELYHLSRHRPGDGKALESTLIDDTNLVTACEVLLIHYATNESEDVRIAAGDCLARFGTKTALQYALKMAHSETFPKVRAGVWSAIARLVEPPFIMPNPLPPSTPSNSISGVWSDPGFRAFINHGGRDFILPVGIDRMTIEDEVIHEFETDDGSCTVRVVDKIPFVPFSRSESIATWTVRERIAESLQWAAIRNPRIRAEFKRLSAHQNPKISAPAQKVLQNPFAPNAKD